MHPLVGVLIAYALGSIPAAYLAGRARGIDLRTQGSGNLGATNTVRVLGPGIGLAVFAFDMAKGALPVALLPRFTASGIAGEWLGIMYGVAAIIGHVRPLWLGFSKGGKGVATACGVFAALVPVPTAWTLAVFLAAFGASGYVSLGSLAGAVALPVLVAVTGGGRAPAFAVSVPVALFVFWTHRPNIARLRSGEEHRFGRMGRLSIGASCGAAALVLAVAIMWAMRGGLR